MGTYDKYKKTEYLVIGREDVSDLQLDSGVSIPGVEKFKYLGTIFDKNGQIGTEIQERVNQSRAALRMLNSIWWDQHITRKTKVIIYKSIVESILTYGSEVWIINKHNESKLLATEMDALRRSMRRSRLERLRNDFIRHEMNALETVIDRVQQKQMIWYGHLNRMPDERWPKQLFQWVPLERNKRGRPRQSWKQEMRRVMSLRSLHEGDWDNREQWRIGVKSRRRQP